MLCLEPRYKHEIRREDQEALRKLVKVQYHRKMTPEIQRELEAARARGDKEVPSTPALVAKSHVSKHVTEDVRSLPPVLTDEDCR